MASFGDRVAAAKPYIIGLVVGLVAAPVIGLWNGNLVTSSTRDEQVQDASVDVLAQICERLARANRVVTGDTAELTGYKGRDARNALATQFAVMPGEAEADSAVERACADRLSVPEV